MFGYTQKELLKISQLILQLVTIQAIFIAIELSNSFSVYKDLETVDELTFMIKDIRKYSLLNLVWTILTSIYIYSLFDSKAVFLNFIVFFSVYVYSMVSMDTTLKQTTEKKNLPYTNIWREMFRV